MVYEHGGDVYRNKVRLDFSVNTNPLGMSENVKKSNRGKYRTVRYLS